MPSYHMTPIPEAQKKILEYLKSDQKIPSGICFLNIVYTYFLTQEFFMDLTHPFFCAAEFMGMMKYEMTIEKLLKLQQQLMKALSLITNSFGEEALHKAIVDMDKKILLPQIRNGRFLSEDDYPFITWVLRSEEVETDYVCLKEEMESFLMSLRRSLEGDIVLDILSRSPMIGELAQRYAAIHAFMNDFEDFTRKYEEEEGEDPNHSEERVITLDQLYEQYVAESRPNNIN